MLPNDDRISKLRKGRLFGLSLPEVLHMILELGFQHSEYRKRIDIALMNPEHESQYGTLLASFCPGDFMALFSLPDNISPERAKSLATAAILEFAAIDRNSTPKWSRQKTVTLRAYLGDLNKIVITERHCSQTLAKYRGGAKFSNAFKPKAVQVNEKVIREIMA